jgi:hypothetical protein
MTVSKPTKADIRIGTTSPVHARRRPRSARLLTIAVHEAGHVVMGWYLGLPLKKGSGPNTNGVTATVMDRVAARPSRPYP